MIVVSAHHLCESGEGQALSRSYGRCFAEFLNKGSLVRLSLLDLSTCVGLQYGYQWPNVNYLFLAPHLPKLSPPGGFLSCLRNVYIQNTLRVQRY